MKLSISAVLATSSSMDIKLGSFFIGDGSPPFWSPNLGLLLQVSLPLTSGEPPARPAGGLSGGERDLRLAGGGGDGGIRSAVLASEAVSVISSSELSFVGPAKYKIGNQKSRFQSRVEFQLTQANKFLDNLDTSFKQALFLAFRLILPLLAVPLVVFAVAHVGCDPHRRDDELGKRIQQVLSTRLKWLKRPHLHLAGAPVSRGKAWQFSPSQGGAFQNGAECSRTCSR